MGEVLTGEVKSGADYINTGKTVGVLLTLRSPLSFQVYSNTRGKLFLRNPRECFCDSSYWIIIFCAWEEISHVDIFNSLREPHT